MLFRGFLIFPSGTLALFTVRFLTIYDPLDEFPNAKIECGIKDQK